LHISKVCVTARITDGITYKPFLSRDLHTFGTKEFPFALAKEATFLLKLSQEQQIAVSWWVSAKRTRSYPFARVYDSLNFPKKCTIIPIFKDEFGAGDRDYLQFDTVSLMSLLNVYLILGYYIDAEPNRRFPDKITNQRYDTTFLLDEIQKLPFFHQSALHWNMGQIAKIGEIGEKAVASYLQIEKKLGRKMHSPDAAREHIRKIQQSRESFINYSRNLSKQAQAREVVTVQPKELCEGEKGAITITNYLGGQYNFTCDEVRIENNDILLIEDKHSKNKKLPSQNDIKDGLLKMMLLTNLKEVKVDGKQLNPKPILKLTTGKEAILTADDKEMLTKLRLESKTNGFKVFLNSPLIKGGPGLTP
jgi:hypothetical protein